MTAEDRASEREPIRTCVGCRSRAEKSTLLRVVVDGSGPVPGLVPDPDGRLPGRGAYIHPSPGCLDIAARRRAFSRAFRREGPLDVKVVRRWLDQQRGPVQALEATPVGPVRLNGQEEGDTT